MKNIYILPTPQPSRLVKFFTNKFHLCKEILPIQDEEQYQNIYITNDEEIKDGDWCLCSEELVHKVVEIKSNIGIIRFQDGVTEVLNACEKIILTTDQDLIKDGVQAIDDEFLEWFVKNPTCEFVDIESLIAGFVDDEPSYYENMYDIIIPKEEVKQSTKERIMSETSKETKQKARDYGNSLVMELIELVNNRSLNSVKTIFKKEDISFWLQKEEDNIKEAYSQGRFDEETIFPYATDEDDYFNRKFTQSLEKSVNPNNQEVMFHEEHQEYFHEDFIDGKKVTVWLGKDYIPKEEPKQETLEEFINSQPYYGTCTTEYLEGIEAGAKWQQEQDNKMYSEEEIIDLIQFLSMYEEFNQEGSVSKETAKYFLEKFKNK